MTRRTYHVPEALDRTSAEGRLASADPLVVASTLVSLALYEADWRWVEACCVEAASHTSLQVRAVVPTCLGHLARIHRMMDWAVVEPVLARLSAEPELAGRVEDARDDFEAFLGKRSLADRDRTG